MTTGDWDSFAIDGEEIEAITGFTFFGIKIGKVGREGVIRAANASDFIVNLPIL